MKWPQLISFVMLLFQSETTRNKEKITQKFWAIGNFCHIQTRETDKDKRQLLRTSSITIRGGVEETSSFLRYRKPPFSVKLIRNKAIITTHEMAKVTELMASNCFVFGLASEKTWVLFYLNLRIVSCLHLCTLVRLIRNGDVGLISVFAYHAVGLGGERN